MKSTKVIQSIDFKELRDLATSVAQAAGEYVLSEYENLILHQTKSSSSDFVTSVDKTTETLIASLIGDQRPHDSFLGEEGTNRKGTSGVMWVIDPIDGTTNFIHKHPGFGVSIAAKVNGKVIAGAVADPVHSEIFDAALNQGARCNGDKIRITRSPELETSLVATGFSYIDTKRTEQAKILLHVLPAIADIRRMGSAAIDLCSVAMSRVDAFFETGLNEWDVAAGSLIASEAGATIQTIANFAGETLTVAVNPCIEKPFLQLLDTAKRNANEIY